MTKVCSKCGVPKDVGEFHRDRSHKDGRRSRCKACNDEYYREHREANREKLAEKQRAYYAENREKCIERQRAYKDVNSGKIARYHHDYHAANRERRNEQKREHYGANRERIAERNRRYYEANREKYAEYQREYRAAQPGGVYRLTCVPTGEVYFGSASNLQSRETDHYQLLRKGAHKNPRVRELSKSHKPDDFTFEIIIHTDDQEEGLLYEQLLIDSFPCCNVQNTDGTRITNEPTEVCR